MFDTDGTCLIFYSTRTTKYSRGINNNDKNIYELSLQNYGLENS